MKADLANSWIMMAIVPNVVTGDFVDKYVACLLGDEMATDDEFYGMMVKGYHWQVGDGCRFNLDGTCYHPFRPGSMISAIFATSFRGQDNAGDLVNNEIVDVMDSRERRCHPPCGCCLSLPGFREMEDSAFHCIAQFYEELFDRAKNKSLYGRTYEEFRKLYARGIEEKGFFFDCSPLKEHESNIRKHFDMMMKTHFDLISEAIDKDAAFLEDKKGKSELGKAITRVRMDLVMHSMTYWEKGKYKEDINA
jgi:hypothetical protein